MTELPYEYDRSWSLKQAVQEKVNREDERTYMALKEERQFAPDTVTTFKPKRERVKSMVWSWMP